MSLISAKGVSLNYGAASVLQDVDLTIEAGEIVTTGTITTAQSVQAGETWRSEVRGIGLPGLTVDFSA